MGVTIGTYLGEILSPAQPGWSVITASGSPQDGWNGSPPASTNDTMKVYVSSSTGKDLGDSGYNGATAGSQATPFRTVAMGMSKLRSSAPDWLLLKRGDVWTNDDFNGSGGQPGTLQQFPVGLSATAPMVIRDYGTGARPLFKKHPAAGNGVLGTSGGSRSSMNRLALIGIEFYDYSRDPTSATDFDLTGTASSEERGCFGISNSFDFLLIEDCKFSYYAGQINIEPDINSPPYSGTGFYFRRNVVLSAYPAYGRSQGMFVGNVSADGWLIEENTFDSNGGNLTLSQDVTVTINAATDVVSFAISLPAGTFTPGDNVGAPPYGATIIFSQTGGGLTAFTEYHAVSKSGNTFKVSATSGGSPIDITAGVVSPQTANWKDPSCGNGGNRSLYVSAANGLTGKGIARGNISSRSASDGFQFRTGGDIYNNLMARNRFSGHTVGGSQQADTPLTYSYAHVYNNVIIDTQKLQTFPPSGDGNGVNIQNMQGDIMIGPGNIYARGVGTSAGAINFDKDVVNGKASGNVIYSYAIGANSAGVGGPTSQGLSVVDAGGSGYNNSDPGYFEHVTATGGGGSNLGLWVRTASNAVVQVLPDSQSNVGGYVGGDVIGLNNATGTPSMGGVGSGFHTTITQVGNTQTSDLGPNTVDLAGVNPGGIFPDPTRSVETYDSIVLGGPGTFDHFISLASQQTNGNWNSALTANAVNNWIRAGFVLSGPGHKNLKGDF